MDTPAPRLLLRLPSLYPKQARFVHAKTKFTVCFASTKAGKTVGMITRIVADAWERGKPGRDWYWYAPSYGVSKIAYLRLIRWLNKADPKQRIWRKNDSELFVELKPGSRIYFKGAERPDMLFGPDAWGVVIDEGTRCREQMLEVALSVTTATDGWIAIIGNMKSRGDWMYKLWHQGNQGDPDITSLKLDAWDAVEGGVLQRSVIEQAQKRLPRHVFEALYLAIPSDRGTNPFGQEYIDAAGGSLSPVATDAMGVDLAKSVDWTWVVGLDKYGQATVDERWQAPWELTTPKLIRLIGKTPCLMDSTGVGDPILERVQQKCPKVQGYKFTSSSKQILMEGLSVALQQSELSGLSALLRAELEIFEYEYTATGVRYSAPEGMHDDGVMALALAVHKQGKRNRKRGRVVLPTGDQYADADAA